MNIHCNAGVTATSTVGTLPGYGEVWYHATGIANILSLSRVWQKGFTIKYNSAQNHFTIQGRANKTAHTFKSSDRVLFYLDTATNTSSETVLTNTVAHSKSKIFTTRLFTCSYRTKFTLQITKLFFGSLNETWFRTVQLPGVMLSTLRSFLVLMLGPSKGKLYDILLFWTTCHLISCPSIGNMACCQYLLCQQKHVFYYSVTAYSIHDCWMHSQLW
jgi:hypothetical protein